MSVVYRPCKSFLTAKIITSFKINATAHLDMQLAEHARAVHAVLEQQAGVPVCVRVCKHVRERERVCVVGGRLW